MRGPGMPSPWEGSRPQLKQASIPRYLPQAQPNVCGLRRSACQHIALYSAEPRAQTIVEHLVADTDDQATDQRWVDAETQLQTIAVALAQLGSDLCTLSIVDRNFRENMPVKPPGCALAIALEALDDRRQAVKRALTRQSQQEVANLTRRVSRQCGVDTRLEIGAVGARALELGRRCAQRLKRPI